MENIFKTEVNQGIIDRINKLTPETKMLWGKMDVAQMLAHCNVTYEMVYTDKHPKISGVKKFFVKLLVKPLVTGNKPYKKNTHTAPQFIILEKKNFEEEKTRLIGYLQKTQELGESYFEGLESLSFGNLSASEWNMMFYKHLDHHLNQFGV